MKQFNNWLANVLGNTLSSMTFFYVCAVLDIIELYPVAKDGSVIVWCTYLSQTVIQLLALPILGYQAKIQQDNHQALKEHIDRHMDRLHTNLRKPKVK